MMAFDRSATPPSLDPQTIEALRTIFSRCVRDGGQSEELQAVLRRAADEARAKSMLPEHLLLALKAVWYSLPELRRTADSAEHAKLLQSLISLCIREYYRPGGR